MQTDNNEIAAKPSLEDHEFEAATSSTPDLTFESVEERAEVDRYEMLRLIIWQGQDGYLKAKFGDKVEHANYGWGSCVYDGGVTESTKVYCAGKVYVLHSWAHFDTPETVEHELVEI